MTRERHSINGQAFDQSAGWGGGLLSRFHSHIVFEAMDRSNWILPVDEIWIDELIYPHIISIQQKCQDSILGFADK